MRFSGKTYDVLKWIAQVVLPAIASLYFALAQIWGLPAAEQVVGTIAVVDTFLGILLGYSSSQYWSNIEKNAGSLTSVGRDPDTGMPHLSMTITKDPDEILSNRKVMLKVQNPEPPPNA